MNWQALSRRIDVKFDVFRWVGRMHQSIWYGNIPRIF